MNTSKRRYSRDQWEGLVKEARESQLTEAEWCMEHGVSVRALTFWTRWFDGKAAGISAPGVEQATTMKERPLGEPGEVSYRDQEITFVEMPQFHALSKKPAKSACELPRQDEGLVVQLGST